MAQKELEDSRLLDQTGQKRDLSVVPQIRPVDIKNDIARASSALDKMDMPALGMRLKADIARAREQLDASKDSDSLVKAKERIDRLSDFFKAESRILQNVPSELPKRLTLDRIIDAIDSTIEDPSRAKIVLAAASLYAAHAGRYDSERAERDALFDFMVDRGSASPYKESKLDEGILRSFQSNALILEDGERKMVAAWRREISRQLPLVKSPEVAAALKELDQDLKTNGIDAEGSAQRYHAIMGTAPPPSAEMRLGSLRDGAIELSGKAGDIGWYGTKALEALDSGDSGAASLALSMGMLLRESGSTFLVAGLRKEIHDRIADHSEIPRPELSRYLGEVHSATVLAESARLESEAPLVGTPGRRSMAKLIRLAAAEIRDRAPNDMESARRLMEMADGYSKLVKSMGWKAWPGSSDMEAGLRAELEGENGTASFEAGLARSAFAGEIKEFRAALSKWGRDLSPQKEAAAEALSKVDELAGAGRSAEARRMLSITVMYADAVVRLSDVGRGSPAAIDHHVPSSIIGKLDSSFSALVSGGRAEEAFMAGYSECMQTYATLRASSLSQLMRTRIVGQDAIKAALEESKSRSAAGDFPGAINLLAYVEEFYGPRTPKAAAGWRYDQFDPRVEGYVRGRDGMLQAIGAERSASKPEEHASAERLFDSSLRLLSSTQDMIAGYKDLRDKLAGKTPMLPKVPAGEVPLGEKRPDGAYQTLPLADIKKYESNLKGPKLERILDDCRAAAQRGDTDAYDRAVRSFGDRFGLATNAVAKEQALAKAAKQIDEALKGLGQMREVYGSGQGRDQALLALSMRAMGIRNALAEGKFPEADFASLIADIGTERKLAMGVDFLNKQILLCQGYSVSIKTPTYFLRESEDVRNNVASQLDRSMERLGRAKELLIEGKTNEAHEQYIAAMHFRIDAMIMYSAENAVNFDAALSAHRRHPGPNGIDERFFPAFQYKRQEGEFSGYLNSQVSSFDSMAGGVLSKEVQTAQKGAGLIESSIFGVPANAPTEFMSSFVSEQRDVKNLVQHNHLADAESIVESMKERAEFHKWVANAAVITAGLGSAFIPVVGVWISGSIFTGIAVDQIATEYRLHGHASAEAWAMLGLTIGTMGVGAAASATARLAVTARSAGALARAGRFATLSKAFTYTNLGAGSFMFGYMGAGTWELYKQYRLGNAHFRDVMLSAGMALFPVVHMSVSGVSAYRARTAAARAGQMLPADPEFDPSPGRFKPAEAPGFDSPEGIFGFMQRLASQNPLAVAQFGRLPAPARSALVSWMSKQGPVRMALETGSPNDLAIRSIRGGMDGLQPVTRPQADISLLTDRAQLAALLRDILSTGKTPSELSQKNAAHATLERIRASNPDAARYIDRLVNDGGYAGLRSDLLSGRPLSQKSVTILQNNSVLIGAELPEGMRPLAMAANEGIRASVGDESSKPPPRVGGVTPARESAPAGIESKASEEKLAPEEMQPAVRRELTHAEQEMFVDNPKQLMKGVFGEETSLEDIAMHDIDDPEWLEPKPDHVEMLQTRSVVLEKMRGYFNEAAKGMNWSEEAIKRYGDAFISLLDVSERNGYTTYGHTMRVAEYTNKTLERMDIPVEEKAKIRLAALIHDVGKIGVKNEILRLPRKTTLAEREIVGKHAGFSEVVANGIFAKIGLVDAKGFKEISEIAKYHQEYFDGTKYFQKKGTDIPLGARIIALADAYDAMTSIRSYNKVPNAQDKAIGIIQNGGGTQFDPELVPIFIEAITSK